ncbi:retrovirus-related pol polyprotein from transposon TNT 1-94 [Tanacetum coccineum]
MSSAQVISSLPLISCLVPWTNEIARDCQGVMWRDKQFYQSQDAHHSSVIHHQSYQSPVYHPSSQANFSHLDSVLAAPSFLPSDDPIANGKVTVQTIQGRQTQGYVGSGVRSNATGSSVNRNGGISTADLPKVIRFYNCQEEGHMARQCTKPKRPRNLAWFKEKISLAEALESGVALDEEQMTFLEDNGDTFTTSQECQEIPTLVIFQTDDLDAFASDSDEAPFASAVLIAKLSAYESNVLSEVPTDDTHLDNHVIDQSMQEMLYFEQPFFNNQIDSDITSDSNVISYEQYLKETVRFKRLQNDS